MNSTEYRLKYEYLTNRKIPEGFNVHHIDGNRKNNVMTNLVALPLKLHADYHKYEKNPQNSKQFDKVRQIVDEYIKFRDYLRGKSEVYSPEYCY